MKESRHTQNKSWSRSYGEYKIDLTEVKSRIVVTKGYARGCEKYGSMGS